ncbi:MAG: hypothetical protein ACN4IE_17800, partial [Ilumatobacter sp.]
MVHPRPASVPAEPARGRRLGILLATVGLLAGACSGDDDSADATTAPTTLNPETTTEPATTTTRPSPTTVPETTVASTPPTTPVPPTTTLGPEATITTTITTTTPTTVRDPEVQAVIDGLIASWTAFGELLKDPFDDDKLALVAERERGDALAASLEVVEDFRVRNLRTIENSDVPSEIVPLPETVRIEGSTATIDYCWVNSDAVVETAG